MEAPQEVVAPAEAEIPVDASDRSDENAAAIKELEGMYTEVPPEPGDEAIPPEEEAPPEPGDEAIPPEEEEEAPEAATDDDPRLLALAERWGISEANARALGPVGLAEVVGQMARKGGDEPEQPEQPEPEASKALENTLDPETYEADLIQHFQSVVDRGNEMAEQIRTMQQRLAETEQFSQAQNEQRVQAEFLDALSGLDDAFSAQLGKDGEKLNAAQETNRQQLLDEMGVQAQARQLRRQPELSIADLTKKAASVMFNDELRQQARQEVVKGVKKRSTQIIHPPTQRRPVKPEKSDEAAEQAVADVVYGEE